MWWSLTEYWTQQYIYYWGKYIEEQQCIWQIYPLQDGGSFSYDKNVRPHAVTEVENTDGKIPGDALTTSFNDFGKIQLIEDADKSLRMDFSYGPNLSIHLLTVSLLPVSSFVSIFIMPPCVCVTIFFVISTPCAVFACKGIQFVRSDQIKSVLLLAMRVKN